MVVIGAYALGMVLVGAGTVVGSKAKAAYRDYTWRRDTAAFHAYCEAIDHTGAAR